MPDFYSIQAAQRPEWGDEVLVQQIRAELSRRPGLVESRDVRGLSTALAEVAAGDSLVLQAGDCAEDPADCTSASVARKAALLEILGGFLRLSTGCRIVRVGRMAGQFAKPRTKPTEWVGGRSLPVYRGHMVNSPEPDPVGRVPDPSRLLEGYEASRATLAHLGWLATRETPAGSPPTWVSHEALLLDYEVPLLRRDEEQRLFLSSTHWPWIGERTRDPDGAHIALLSHVSNPVACKIGPSATAEEVLALAEALDPERVPGRLTFIARMGTDTVGSVLPGLVAAVRAAGHPVIWLSDPMHGNTVVGPDGLKTRYVSSVVQEVRAFLQAVRAEGGIAGGLHLEATPDDVTECVHYPSQASIVPQKYLSLCDPRLNLNQALTVVSAWEG